MAQNILKSQTHSKSLYPLYFAKNSKILWKIIQYIYNELDDIMIDIDTGVRYGTI